MMRYILDNHIALRSWRLVPYAYYIKDTRNARGLKKDEYELLSLCDGGHDIEDGELIASLFKRGFCHPCTDGESLTEWQKPHVCDNRYFPAMNWMITGKCNYNCLHCFNAADNAPLMNEWTLDDANRLLDQAEKCGINAFTLTGGEPMLHKNFFDILEGIYRRGMYVEELNTNGHFLTQNALDRMKATGCNPLIKISFDGIGHHDWLRNRKGAEEDALRAIRLCIENGFSVKAQTNVWRGNEESMLPTAELLENIGVSEMRIIRTTEAPRWVKNSGNATLGLTEYYDNMLAFAGEYVKTPHKMKVDMWQFLTLLPQSQSYAARPVECGEGEYRDTLPVCRGNRGMVAVGADGKVFPCHQMSGYYEGHGWNLGNVKKDGLQPLLQNSPYLSEVCVTVRELATENTKCGSCKYFKYCCGGCRAIALALTGNKLGCDLAKCLFFENGYYQKISDKLNEWYNNTDIAAVHPDTRDFPYHI